MKSLFILFSLFTTALYAQFKVYYTKPYDDLLFEKIANKQEVKTAQNIYENFYLSEFLPLSFNYVKDVTIPVMINVITSDSRTISLEKIKNQIDHLNKGFNLELTSKLNDNPYNSLAVKTQISFCMYTDGKPNVNFIKKASTEFKDKEGYNEMKTNEKGIEATDPDKFINIWICDLGEYTQNGWTRNMAGYAQLPFRDKNTDGIVIDYDYFGSNPESEYYKEGSTLIHLMGNYFGLIPLYGWHLCTDDLVDDTPMHNDETLLCTDGNIISTCLSQNRYMVGNFMDNTPDGCGYMFTNGQKIKMHSTLHPKGPRHHLILNNQNYKCDGQGVSQVNESKLNTVFFEIFPNPASNQINLSIKTNELLNKEFSIYDINGKSIKKGILTSMNSSIETTEWASGLYFIKIVDGNKIYSKSFEIIQ